MGNRHQQLHGNYCLKNNYSTRSETYEGRDHLVAPVVILTEGVHAGSAGPLYYPREELRRFPQAWNGIPLPVNHPDINGVPTIANSPEIIDRQSVGRLFNVRYDEVGGIGRLRGELWVDVAKAQEVSPAILQRLQQNQPLEVSTGLYSDDEPSTGNWNGEAYQIIARNYRPEHLALLPDAIGACSIADGCGVRTNQKKDEDMRRNKRDDFPKSNAQKDVQKYMSDSLLTNVGMVEVRDKLQSALDHLDVFEGPTRAVHYLREFMPTNETSGRLIAHIHREDDTTTDQAIYTLETNGTVTIGEFSRVIERTTFEPVNNSEEEEKTKNNKCTSCNCDRNTPKKLNNNHTPKEDGGEEMAANSPERAGKVSAVITANVGFGEDHREGLHGLDCGMFAAIEAVVTKVGDLTGNAVKVPTNIAEAIAFLPEPEQVRINEGLKVMDAKRKELVDSITANEKNPFTEDELNSMTVERLEGLSSFASGVEEEEEVVSNFGANTGAEIKVNEEGKGKGLSTPKPMVFE